MKRRYFLPAVAAGLNAVRSAAASDRVNVAVIGVRGRGRALTGGFAKLADANVEYLVDVDDRVVPAALAVLEKAGRKPPKVVRDMRRVFDDKSIDAVVIATPDHWHAPAAIMACDAGKDVYLEKPCSHNIREGRLIVEAARRSQRIVQHGTQARSREITRQAIDYIHSGKIGKVVMAKAWDVQRRADIGHKNDSPVPAEVDYDTWIGPAQPMPFNENRFHYTWHWNWNFGTGDAGNDGAHQIDMARWALGVEVPTEAAGMGAKLFFEDDQQTPDTINATFRYPGKMLMFELRIWNPYGMEATENGVAVYGGDGMVQIAKWDRLWGYKVFDEKGKLVKHEQSPGEDEAHVRNFLECVKSRKAPNAEIEIGFQSVVHCHLANIVARTGRAVRYDAKNDSVTGDPEAAKLTRRTYRDHWSKPRGV
ncbi:Gfo/Idh/MocA family oxidoreductase [uncultured Paludibaculum sp.]|uniref:Gfo/Idh/MocA family protein n=1 Tax=uncultured Paludibaculum sp. TaxID=1765020 RepID=UPI002AAB132B|nr:Gfo/Idh/MocA family oxidoreductase [uncultured Paludibaculum sp.]